MSKLNFRLVLSLETLSLALIIVGFALLLSSCRTYKDVSTDTTKEHSETSDTTITYSDKVVDIKIDGEKVLNEGDSLKVTPNDSIPVIFDNPCTNTTDTIYITPPSNPKLYNINMPQVIAWGKYGYAKGVVENSKLKVEFHIFDRIIQQTIDSAIIQINVNKLIKDTETKTIVKTRKDLMKLGLPIMLLLIIVAVIVARLPYGGSRN